MFLRRLDMTRKNSELSTLSILAISVVFAILGSIFYGLMAPIPPAKRIALAHAAVNEMATTHANGPNKWN